MGFGSIWPWVIVLAIVLLLFGRGKVSGLLGDIGHGVKSFKRGLADDDKTLTNSPGEQVAADPVKAAEGDERTNAG